MRNRFANERGQFTIMVGLVGVILLLVSGFSVSEAYLAYRKTQVRRAVDASALVGMNSYISNLDAGLADNPNSTSSAAKDRAKADAISLVQYNLKMYGINVSDWNAAMSGTGFLVPAVGDITTPTRFLVNANIPIGSLASALLRLPKSTVQATAKAQRNRAYIVMVLDTSGSMGTSSKLPNLKKAARSFIRKFNLSAGQDRIAIITFSSYATVQAGLNDNDTGTYTGSQYKDILCGVNDIGGIIGALTADGYTNFAAAFTAARLQLEKGVPTSETATALKYIVFMSDGAPTAMTARWMNLGGTNGGNSLIQNFPRSPDSPAENLYTIKLKSSINEVSFFKEASLWTSSTTAPDSHPNNFFYGAFYNDPNDLTPPYDIISRWYWAPLNQGSGKSNVLIPYCSSHNNQGAAGCLANFGWTDSKGNPDGSGTLGAGTAWGSGVTTLTTESTEAKREIYNAGIIESDYAKDPWSANVPGATIYTIGLGTTTAAAKSNVPYNDVSQDPNLHPNVMRRIANAPPYTDTFQTHITSGTVSLPTTKSTHPVGIYLETPNSSQLTQLFNTIAQKIKLKLVE